MKNKIYMSFLIVLIVSSISVLAINNPAAEYCLEEGNSYEKRIDVDNNEYGVCVTVDGEIDVWHFYSNKIKTNNKVQTFNDVTKNDDSKNSLIPDKLMMKAQSNVQTMPLKGSHPSAFDWRNQNGNWLTPIKDQSSCGSCWAFSAVGVSEAKVNINLNEAEFNINLAEQDLISCSNEAGDCDGGYESKALEYIKNNGIVRESCFGYTASNNVCSNKCSNWNNELVKIDYNSVSPTADAIKEAISNEGPITVYMVVCDSFDGVGVDNHAGDVYYDDSCWWTDGQDWFLNWHAIDVVGYDDGGQYWIGRNSWGSGWGDNGYFKIAYQDSVYNYRSWIDAVFDDPDGDDRVFFLDDSYVVTTTDIDNDGVSDSSDNCPEVSNPTQTNSDDDEIGNDCDLDDDNDGILDVGDDCQIEAGPSCNRGCPDTTAPIISVNSPLPIRYFNPNILVRLAVTDFIEEEPVTEIIMNSNKVDKEKLLKLNLKGGSSSSSSSSGGGGGVSCLNTVWMDDGNENITLDYPYEEMYTFIQGDNDVTFYAEDTSNNIGTVNVLFNVNTARENILCDTTTQIVHNCSYASSVTSIDSINIETSLVDPNETIEIEINWTGWHYYDNNYWAFFLDDSTEVIGSCETDLVGDYDINNLYTMNCEITLPANTTPGVHTVKVTADDYLGYCDPGEEYVDVESSIDINVNCKPFWVLDNNSCGVDDQILISYTDSNSCGSLDDIPEDNNMYSECDYCTPNWVEVNGTCIGYYKESYSVDNNDCYAQTGLESDNNQPENNTYLCEGCIVPIDGMEIDRDTTFCQGEYFLPNGINVINNGITLDCDNAKIYGEYSTSGQDTKGISITDISSTTVINCIVDNYKRAIKTFNSDNLTIEDNQLRPTQGNTALYLQDTKESIIQRNNIKGTTYVNGDSYGNILMDNYHYIGDVLSAGVYLLSESHDNLVAHSEFIGTYDGIDLQHGSYNNTLDNNIFENNNRGIILVGSEDNTIKNNRISASNPPEEYVGLKGIVIGDSSTEGNLIYDNNISDMNTCMYVKETSDNTIFNNNFLDCSTYAYDEDSTVWSTIIEGGNYWDNFNEPSEGCNDNNSDGVCDSPYVIDEDSQDNYPFIELNGWENIYTCQLSWSCSSYGECQTDDNTYCNAAVDDNSCFANLADVYSDDFSEFDTQQCDYCTPDWKPVNSTCSIQDEITQSYVDDNNCYSLTGLESDNSSPEEETYSCDYCQYETDYTDWTDWEDQDECLINNTQLQNRSRTEYDLNYDTCYALTNLESDLWANVTHVETQEVTCDYCVPNWTETLNACQEDDSQTGYFIDENGCYDLTGLDSDLEAKPDNTSYEYHCDYDGDGFIGSIDNINTTLNLTQTNENGTLVFKENDSIILQSDYNLSQTSCNLAELTIEQQDNTSTIGYILIGGLDLTALNQTKTVYMNKLSSGTGICIKDQEITSITEVTGDCNGVNETWVACPGNSVPYSCELANNETKYKVSGLSHSGVKEQTTYCGDGSCNGGESCSSCSTDCGVCDIPSTPSSPGGGGGGGGSSGPRVTQTIETPTEDEPNTPTVIDDSNENNVENDDVLDISNGFDEIMANGEATEQPGFAQRAWNWVKGLFTTSGDNALTGAAIGTSSNVETSSSSTETSYVWWTLLGLFVAGLGTGIYLKLKKSKKKIE